MDKMKPLRILHLEDDPCDAELVRRALEHLTAELRVVVSRAEYVRALEAGDYDLILSDNQLPGIRGLEAMNLAHLKNPAIPFVFVSGHLSAPDIDNFKAAGAADCVLKSELPRLVIAIRKAVESRGVSPHERAMERLVSVVQELSLARDVEAIMRIVRRAARELTGADGATFVLHDRDCCYYADEDAIAPLWKGRRFPLSACISGWVMLNRRHVVIEDIYADARIPHEAYRPTFVKSLAMVPIRTLDPLGAIGNYWAEPHAASAEEVKLLQALADTTAVAMENVRVYAELEQRVRDRTRELEVANKELEAFSYAVSHDLRAPLRHISAFSEMLSQDCADALDERARHYLARIGTATERMGHIIEDLLTLSRTTRWPVERQSVDLTRLAAQVALDLRASAPEREADFVIGERLFANGDARLLRVVLENLLGNAWKFTSRCGRARIEVGVLTEPGEQPTYYVRDNGAGFHMADANRLFDPFQRLHSQDEFPGTGVGLATVQRIVHKHGGHVWAEADVGRGATFYFTLA